MDEYLSQAVRPEGNNATCPYSSEPKKVLCLCYTQGWTFQIFVLASSTVMLELHFNTDCHIAALCPGLPPIQFLILDSGREGLQMRLLPLWAHACLPNYLITKNCWSRAYVRLMVASVSIPTAYHRRFNNDVTRCNRKGGKGNILLSRCQYHHPVTIATCAIELGGGPPAYYVLDL